MKNFAQVLCLAQVCLAQFFCTSLVGFCPYSSTYVFVGCASLCAADTSTVGSVETGILTSLSAMFSVSRGSERGCFYRLRQICLNKRVSERQREIKSNQRQVLYLFGVKYKHWEMINEKKLFSFGDFTMNQKNGRTCYSPALKPLSKLLAVRCSFTRGPAGVRHTPTLTATERPCNFRLNHTNV